MLKKWFVVLVMVVWQGGVLAKRMTGEKHEGIITSNQVYQIVEKNNNEYIILDIRDSSSFKSGHIPNAMNYNIDDLRKVIENLPKDRSYIVTGKDTNDISEAINLFKENKLSVFVHQGGMDDWLANKLPVESASKIGFVLVGAES